MRVTFLQYFISVINYIVKCANIHSNKFCCCLISISRDIYCHDRYGFLFLSNNQKSFTFRCSIFACVDYRKGGK
uniref:Uncharacterized protein n=1 Tax=Daphnia magna TaxID=35525 RepID=A0A0N8EL98_9CRUS